MAKMTLLEMTQNILSAMDGEEVTSISDTIESQQVADEVKTTYYESLGQWEVPSRFELVNLTGLGDSDHPNVLQVPDNVSQFEWIKYNVNTTVSPDYIDIEYCQPKDFLDWVFENGAGAGTLGTVLDITTDSPYKVRSDKNPQFYTLFDDKHVVFDSYNSSLDATLQQAKNLAYAEVFPAWTASDAFIPDLPERYFPMFLAEAKSACFINYKGVANSKEEQRARRQKVTLQNNKKRFNGNTSSNSPNFGRS